MNDTFMRQWQMLRLVPRFPSKVSTLQLVHSLAEAGFEVTRRTLQQGQTLKPVLIDAAIQQQVYDGLLRNRKLLVNYTARRAPDGKEYEVNPLGLVLKGGISYLVCSIKEYQNIRLLTLHRIEKVNVLEEPLMTPEGFDLDEYIQSGEFGFKMKGEIAFRALFSKAAGLHLRERALSDDQVMKKQEDERIEISATIQDTSELRWWLLGFGSQVEVIEPEYIRADMIKNIQVSMTQYGIAL